MVASIGFYLSGVIAVGIVFIRKPHALGFAAVHANKAYPPSICGPDLRLLKLGTLVHACSLGVGDALKPGAHDCGRVAIILTFGLRD